MPIRGSMLVVSSGIATTSSASGSVAGWARAVAVRAKTSCNTGSQRIITPSLYTDPATDVGTRH